MSKINKTSAETRLAIERRSAAMLPDRPTQAGYKPWDIRNALFSAIIADKGACLMGEINRIVDETNAAIAAMRIESGTLTVATAHWKGTEPPRADCVMGGIFTAGCAVIFMPEDDETKEQAGLARISMAINETMDGEWSDVVVFVGEGGEIPSVDLHFRYIVIPTESETDAIVTLVGVDSDTASGVDEDAVKKIINSLLGNVENERQYSAANPPPYPVTSVNGKTGPVKITASDVKADTVGTAKSLTDALADDIANDLKNYYNKSQTYSRTEIDSKVSEIPKFAVEVVTTLPESGISETTVYLVKDTTEGGGMYTEYIRVNGAWEELGAQKLDLSGYVTDDELEEAVTALRYSLSTLSTGLADTNKAVELRLKIADLPTKLDDYRTAKGLIDKTVSDLANYYTKSQTLTKDEINALVSAIPKFKIEVVTSLPTSNISDTTVYLVKSGDDDTNLYTEYIRANGKWEKLGTQTVDLTGYATEAWVNDVLAAYVKTVDLNEAIAAALASAKDSGDFDGKTAYQYAQDGGYTGTEEEFAAKLAQDWLPKNQGTANAGKILMVGPDGLITLGDVPEGGGGIGYVDSNNNIIITAELPDGTYSVKYETADGLIDIGELELGAVEEPEEPTARLPDGYQEVEWVQIINQEQVDSNSCIITGLNWSEVDKVIVKLQHVNTNNTRDISISSWGGVGAARSAPYIGTRPDTSPDLMGWQSGLTNYSVTPSVSATSPDAHEITATFSSTSDLEIAVGGWLDATHSHPHKWYKMQFYKGETLLADYVPCYRKADNVNGFYDVVRGTFNVNAENQTSANPQLKYFQYRGPDV